MYELHPEPAQNNKKLLRKARSNSYIAEVSWGFSSSDLKVETINLSYLYHCLVEMTLYHYDGSHLPVGWAVWWWPFLWRAMAGCHCSSLVSGRHTPRHECLHHHLVHWHIPWYTSCNLQGGSRMDHSCSGVKWAGLQDKSQALDNTIMTKLLRNVSHLLHLSHAY